jgi:hypothetical protein
VDTASDYISSQKERGVMEQGVSAAFGETSPVARATLHRIMMRHPGMLAQHGPERVMKAVDDVADLVGDMDDIGTSDVSGWVNMVQEILDSLDQDVAEGWKEKLGAAALAGSLAFGASSAQAQPSVKKQVSAKPVATQQASAKSDPFTVNGKTMPQNLRTALFKMSDEDGQQAYTAWRTLVSGTGAQNQMQAGQLLNQLMQKYSVNEQDMSEAEYQGRKVPLGKPMQGDVAKSKVYVKDPKTGNVKKVNFGDPNMKIKKSNPERRKNFRARHNCDNPGPRTKARYWSCRAW